MPVERSGCGRTFAYRNPGRQPRNVFFEHKALYSVKGEVPDDPEYMVPFGKANIVQEGKDVTIVASLLYVSRALEAADLLKKDGISAEVIDPRTLVPAGHRNHSGVGKKDWQTRGCA